MADTRDISGKEQCDILNIFKDHEGNNTLVTQQELIKIKYGGTTPKQPLILKVENHDLFLYS